METINFTYQGNTYSGHLIRSEKHRPFYYWIIFNQPEISSLIGDEIPFVVMDQEVVFVTPPLTELHYVLLHSIKAAVAAHVKNNQLIES